MIQGLHPRDRQPAEGVSFTVDSYEYLIQIPAPLRPIPVRSDSLFSDLRGEHGTKPALSEESGLF